MGLPGSVKTDLAKALKERINAIHLNADEVRATINSDLSFTSEDRIEHARRMGETARLIAKQGVAPVIVDFICPTNLTRAAFGKPDIMIFMDTIYAGRFEDTNKMFEAPIEFDAVSHPALPPPTTTIFLFTISAPFNFIPSTLMKVIKDCLCKYLKACNSTSSYWFFGYCPRYYKCVCCSNNTPCNSLYC